MAGEVGQEGLAEADQRIHRPAVDDGGTGGVAVRGVLHRQTADRWRDDQLTVAQSVLQLVENLRPDAVEAVVVQDAAPGRQPVIVDEGLGQLGPVVPHQVQTLSLPELQLYGGVHADGAAPAFAHFIRATGEGKGEGNQLRARLGKAPGSPLHQAGYLGLHGEDAKIRGVADPPALQGAAQVPGVVRLGPRQAQGVPGIVAGHVVQQDRRVLHGTGQAAVAAVGMGGGPGVGSAHAGHCAN